MQIILFVVYWLLLIAASTMLIAASVSGVAVVWANPKLKLDNTNLCLQMLHWGAGLWVSAMLVGSARSLENVHTVMCHVLLMLTMAVIWGYATKWLTRTCKELERF